MMAVKPREDLPKLRAVVAGGAPCDLTFIPEKTHALASFLGGSRAEFPERYRDASPITFVSRDDPPVFFFHGDDDFVVPINNSMRMQTALEAVGVKTQYHTVKGVGHFLTFLDRQSRLEAIDFLQTNLNPAH